MSYNSPFSGTTIQPTDVSYRSVTLAANIQLQWPVNGTTTTDVATRIMDVSASSAGLSLWMPPADQTSVGNDALIRNTGANAFTVKDYAGTNTIIVIAPGETKYIYITSNPDNQGTWGNIAFGVGSSAVDATTLAGYGLLATGLTLNQSHPVTTFGVDTTINSTARAGVYVWVAGAGTLTLSDAAATGNNWFVMVRNGGTGSLLVDCSGTDTIDGSGSLVFQPGDSAVIVCNGIGYYTVGLGKSTEFAFTQLTKGVTTGTYTLTSTEASNVIQKYTGTLTGNVTIVIPPTVQVYYVQNATNPSPNNYTITITTGLGGSTSAVIGAGNQATLICDSVNVLNANTIIAGGTTLSLLDGNAASPSLYFGSESNTGVYHGAAGEFNISVLGVEEMKITPTGSYLPSGIGGGAF